MGVLFFFLFFFDAFAILIPIDGLLCFMLIFAEDKRRALYYYSIAGAMIGYIILAFLGHTLFLNDIIAFIFSVGLEGAYTETVAQAKNFGYPALVLGASTVVAPMLCLVAAFVVGLNPIITLFIMCVIKAVRLWVMILITLKLKHLVVKHYDNQ